jgi:hypothetical protein
MSTWTTVYEGNTILVENSWFSGERLFVNGSLQDEQLGLGFRSRLWGSIYSADSKIKRIKVTLGASFFSVECRIFIDDALIYSG